MLVGKMDSRFGDAHRCSTGLLVGVKQVLSPHFDARPAGVVPDLIVLHGISLPPGEFGGPWIARLFTGPSAAGTSGILRDARACESRRIC